MHLYAQAKVACVILCGGFSSEGAAPALTPLGSKKAVEYAVRALEGCRRLQPLASSLYLVVNEVG